MPRALTAVAACAAAAATYAAALGAAAPTASAATAPRALGAAAPAVAPLATTPLAAATTAPVVEHAAAPAGVAGVPSGITPLVADFDGDGRDDQLWYGPGALPDHLWLGGAGGVFSGRRVSIGGAYTPVVGDFNGDHRADVLWYGAGSAADVVWFGAAGGRFAGRSVTVGGAYRPLVGDFDGNGRTDVLWYAPGAAPDVLWLAGARGVFTGRTLAVGGTYRPLVGDFDGDHKTDVLWYGPGSAPDTLWYGTSTGAFAGRAFRVGGVYEPAVADLNGDGRRDVVWYGPGAAPDAVFYGSARRGFVGASFVANETGRPVTGDYDGDGRGDVLLYGGAAGTDAVYYGSATGRPVRVGATVTRSYSVSAGDFGGDGRDDLLWYAPGNERDAIWSGYGRAFSFRYITNDVGWTRPPPLRPETVRNAFDPYGFVAHEMGGIDGLVYTNTLDAFQQNYARGFRVFECDQSVLADGTVLVAHDRLETNYDLYGKKFTEATWADLVGHKYKDKYTFIRAQDILNLLRQHPDIYFILDFKNAETQAWATYVRLAGGDPALLDRLFPHVEDPPMLVTMRKAYPLRNYVVALYRSQGGNRMDDQAVVDWALRERFPALMMWHLPRDYSISLAQNHLQQRRYNGTLVQRLKMAGVVPMVHTTDDEGEGEARWGERVGLYTNTLFPPFDPAPVPAATSSTNARIAETDIAPLYADEG